MLGLFFAFLANCDAKVVIISEKSNIFAEKFAEIVKKASFTPKIATLGNILTDILVKIPTDDVLSRFGLPKGSMTLIDEEKYAEIYKFMQDFPIQTATGGSAANTALCIAHLGGDVSYTGKLNLSDRFGAFFRERFTEDGIDFHAISATDKASGICCAFISADGERTFATYLGAAADMQAEELTPEMFRGCAIVHIEGYLVQNHDLILRAIALAHEAGAQVSLDMASYNIVAAEHAFFEKLLPQVDIVFANEEEAAAWHPGTPEESLAHLASICRLSVVKVGARGAWAQCGEERVFGASERVENLVDTTAAGDFFAAGFLYAYSQQRPLAQCLHAGSYCASKVIQVAGTQLTPSMWQDLKTQIS